MDWFPHRSSNTIYIRSRTELYNKSAPTPLNVTTNYSIRSTFNPLNRLLIMNAIESNSNHSRRIRTIIWMLTNVNNKINTKTWACLRSTPGLRKRCPDSHWWVAMIWIEIVVAVERVGREKIFSRIVIKGKKQRLEMHSRWTLQSLLTFNWATSLPNHKYLITIHTTNPKPTITKSSTNKRNPLWEKESRKFTRSSQTNDLRVSTWL